MNKFIKIIIIFTVTIILIVSFLVGLYLYQISPVGSDKKIVVVEIPSNSTGNDIAKILKEKALIRNENIFKIYLKVHNVSGLKSGIYDLQKIMNIEDIVEVLVLGKGSQIGEIDILFKEGKNMRYIAKVIANNTSNTEEEVFSLLKDETYINELINTYWFLTNDIKNTSIYYPLEGYLAPDTYRFANEDVTIRTIFKTMLDQMNKILTPYQKEIEKKGLSVHECLSLASIIELEGAKVSDRATIAGVFYNRLKDNWSLGSDVTTYYAFREDDFTVDLRQAQFDTYNAYNTRGPKMEGKLPVGPIANSSKESIIATIEPEEHYYYYFVADKNKKVYFSRTAAEQSKKIAELKAAGLWL
ncbi:MAG: endolytic transglycosylase MltG [Bacilli bacterium]|nr:endolytic transglycosylase MltG [Bacilli bacterium]